MISVHVKLLSGDMLTIRCPQEHVLIYPLVLQSLPDEIRPLTIHSLQLIQPLQDFSLLPKKNTILLNDNDVLHLVIHPTNYNVRIDLLAIVIDSSTYHEYNRFMVEISDDDDNVLLYLTFYSRTMEQFYYSPLIQPIRSSYHDDYEELIHIPHDLQPITLLQLFDHLPISPAIKQSLTQDLLHEWNEFQPII